MRWGGVTSTNWTRYKILTMEEMPEIKVPQLSRDDKGFGGDSEAFECPCASGRGAPIFDATGVWFHPANINALLKAKPAKV